MTARSTRQQDPAKRTLGAELASNPGVPIAAAALLIGAGSIIAKKEAFDQVAGLFRRQPSSSPSTPPAPAAQSTPPVDLQPTPPTWPLGTPSLLATIVIPPGVRDDDPRLIRLLHTRQSLESQYADAIAAGNGLAANHIAQASNGNARNIAKLTPTPSPSRTASSSPEPATDGAVPSTTSNDGGRGSWLDQIKNAFPNKLGPLPTPSSEGAGVEIGARIIPTLERIGIFSGRSLAKGATTAIAVPLGLAATGNEAKQAEVKRALRETYAVLTGRSKLKVRDGKEKLRGLFK